MQYHYHEFVPTVDEEKTPDARYVSLIAIVFIDYRNKYKTERFASSLFEHMTNQDANKQINFVEFTLGIFMIITHNN